MSLLRCSVALSAVLASTTVWSVASLARAQTPAQEAAANDVPHEPAEFAGLWDYNATESVNAATGRPEQAPQSATQRGTGGAGGGAPRGGRGGVPSSAPSSRGGAFGPPGGGVGVGPTPDMARESRNLARDLLEVPETLDIKVTPSAISFTDDLARERTYPTDGSTQRYQMGAARYEAKVNWAGSQLRKVIEGRYGFKMTETYFLSPDAKRLFVIIRVGDPKPDDPIVGVNRVYDRMN